MAIPLSLYVHIPWCVRKCPYCDFNSHAASGALPEEAYVAALLADLDEELPAAQGRELMSVFIGGGTPSLFSGEAIVALLDGVRARLKLAADCEITLEANPGTAEAERFAGYRAAGVNRLSIGVQSFNDAHLRALGRIHAASDAHVAIAMARDAGFSRINIDLMHGLPEQTVEQAMEDLRTGIDTGVTHLSWYQLTVEPNTEFYSHPPKLPGDITLANIQEAGEALLDQHGFAQYEISAWSQPWQQSRHNLNYWGFGDYIGIGAGAHGKLTLPDGRIVRRWKTRVPADYLADGKDFLAGESASEADELPVEFFMNALRLREGVPTSFFTERTGLSPAIVADRLEDLRVRGLLQRREDRLVTTPSGYRYLDTVLQAFL